MPIIKIEKLVAGGQGLARHDGCVYFVWDALPGEEVEVEVIKKKKNYAEAVVTKVISASPERIESREAHYLNCSPWQILSWPEELKWKKIIATENFLRLAKIELPADLQIVADKKNQYHYRNKIEFNFIYCRSELHLALFERKTNELRLVEECCLADEKLNDAAKNILAWLNTRVDAKNFQKLVVRGDSGGRILAGLYARNKISDFICPLLDKTLVGVSFFQWSGDDNWRLERQLGENYLAETINNIELRYGIESFFQINTLIFKIAIDDMAGFIDSNDSVLDFYSGVGSISLMLAKKFKTGQLIESNDEAAGFAEQNIELNKIKNCRAKRVRAEEAADLISAENVVLLDPPRAGLEKILTAEIIKKQPKRLIYLSCDIATQARDIAQLKDFYNLEFIKLYNFFPRTPHIESLVILDKI